MNLAGEAAALLAAAEIATAGSPNEASLRHELEKSLEASCRRLGVPWTPFRIDLALPALGVATHFADVVHGAVVIEYEPPGSLRGREAGRSTRHARAQACDYVERLGPLEARPLEHYQMVVWDGSHVTFGKYQSGAPMWSTLQVFDLGAALRLLDALGRLAQPLVSAPLVRSVFGPESDLGVALVPVLFEVAQAALTSGSTTRTKLLFTEWRRLFSQAVGLHTDRLEALAAQMGSAQGWD